MNEPKNKELKRKIKELEKENTQLKKDVAFLKESEEKYKGLVNLLPQIIFETDRKGKITFANYHAFDILGYTPDDLAKGVNIFDIIAPPDRKRARKDLQKLQEGTKLDSVEYLLQRKDGNTFPVLSYCAPVIHNHKPVGLRGIAMDLTERKQTEDLVRIQGDLGLELSTASGLEQGLRLCLETALSVSGLDCGGVYLVGKNSGELDLAFHKGLTDNFIENATHYEMNSENIKLVMAGKPIYTKYQDLGVPLDESKKRENLEAIGVLPISHQGRVIGSMNVASHTLEEVPVFSRIALETIAAQIGSAIVHLQAKEALRESERRYELATKAGKVGIWDWNIKTGEFYLDPAVKGFLGYTDEEIPNDLEIWAGYVHPDDQESVMEAAQACIEGKTPEYSYEHRMIHKNGSTCWVRVDGTVTRDEKGDPIRMMGTDTDINSRKIAEEALRESEKKAEEERRKLEEQLFQAQKMESIGRLAGGIAHDFNNILTGIMGYAELLKLDFDDTSTVEGHAAEVIIKSTERAADLTQQLLGFARGGKYNPVPLMVNDIVKETINVSGKIFEKNIDVTFDLDTNIKPVEADKNQLDQVLTNIIINAKDAMPNGGELIFKTGNIYLDEEYTGKFLELKPGDYVKISITDTGMGMPRSIKDRIFEPFFTTKGAGRGTGLGLATVYGIIKNHNGHINCYSEPGAGTTFNLYLPVTEKEMISEKNEVKVITGEETILLVDDEKFVRNVAEKQLERLGYKVITAGDGIEAVDIYKEKKEKIDLVLLDMIMPQMAGKETYQALKNP
jgi:PAS domain S-box-containing protein